MLDPGTIAPPFRLPDQQGRLVSLEDFRGRWILLWWYPKAGTPGCTVEGQDLRDRCGDFARYDCDVVGVSFDSQEENRAWSEAQDFGFTLLSDADHAVGRRYDVEREADDQYAGFALRVSYLIDRDGIIRKSFPVSSVTDHATLALEALDRLKQ